METIFLSNNTDIFFKVYNKEIRDDLSEFTDVDVNVCHTESDVMNNPDKYENVKYIFSTWGMPVFTKERVQSFFPSLKHVFYGAGSVQYFARPFLELGIKVHSAYLANAVPVVEFATSQIILAAKGYFINSFYQSSGNIQKAVESKQYIRGNYKTNIGIIGAGAIGSRVIKLIGSICDVNIFVFDPFLSDDSAKLLNAKKVSLEELFTLCDIISNHLADNEDTKNILNYDLFSKMKENASFINTGRGAQVVEADLVKAMSEKPYRCALLDVTYPEPPINDSPLFTTPNIFMTSHIAGTMASEYNRIASYMYQEFTRIINNMQPEYQITLEMLKTMA